METVNLSNEQIIANIEAHQKAGFTHEYTCGNDSRHKSLIGKEKDKEVILACVECDYEQDVPNGLLDENYLNNLTKSRNRFLDMGISV